MPSKPASHCSSPSTRKFPAVKKQQQQQQHEKKPLIFSVFRSNTLIEMKLYIKEPLPQNDSSGSEKQRPDFACNTFRMDLNEQGENFYDTE